MFGGKQGLFIFKWKFGYIVSSSIVDLTTTILACFAGDVISALVTIPRPELTGWQDTDWSSWFSLSSHGCLQRHSLPQFSWFALSPLITGRNSTSVMESHLYFLLLFSLIIKIARTENITTPPSEELEEKFLKSGDSHIENLTIQLSVEPLPQPSPLIGTFPHDFQLLPSTISRRSSFHRSEGHNYDEQGEDFFLQNRK